MILLPFAIKKSIIEQMKSLMIMFEQFDWFELNDENVKYNFLWEISWISIIKLFSKNLKLNK